MAIIIPIYVNYEQNYQPPLCIIYSALLQYSINATYSNNIYCTCICYTTCIGRYLYLLKESWETAITHPRISRVYLTIYSSDTNENVALFTATCCCGIVVLQYRGSLYVYTYRCILPARLKIIRHTVESICRYFDFR